MHVIFSLRLSEYIIEQIFFTEREWIKSNSEVNSSH